MRTEVLEVASKPWSTARNSGKGGSLSSEGLNIDSVGGVGDRIGSNTTVSSGFEVHDRSIAARVG